MRGNRFDFGSLDIAVHTPTYAMMISVIEGSSMLGVVPKRVGEKFAEKYGLRSEEHTSELQSLMRISYAVFCLKKKNITQSIISKIHTIQQHNSDIILCKTQNIIQRTHQD